MKGTSFEFGRTVAGVLLAAIAFGATTSSAAPSVARPTDREPVVARLEVEGFCDCSLCCGWRRDAQGHSVHAAGPAEGKPYVYGSTTSGTRAHFGSIAADTARFPYGTIMDVPGYGCGVVESQYVPPVSTNAVAVASTNAPSGTIRVWFPNHARAVKWGHEPLDVAVWDPSWKASATPATPAKPKQP